MNKDRIVILSGAGISAESGIQTFRDAGGLWEGYDVMEVASPEGWRKNKNLVLDFYNQRRRQLLTVAPNPAHLAIVELENYYDVWVITQNVDDLHERAGTKQIVHLHGELLKARSTLDDKLVYPWDKDIQPGDKCEKGSQLRPHIVWFGEMVPELNRAAELISQASVVLIVGTSMQVYPAAGLISYAPKQATVYYIDPNPQVNFELSRSHNLTIVKDKASIGVPKTISELIALKKSAT